MFFRLPIRRFLQSTTKIETPQNRIGTLQWVLSRPLYRFQIFDLSQVPLKNRAQALNLELAQWTPYAESEYYVGWQGAYAMVWGWDADKVRQAIIAHGLKPQRAHLLPETVLQTPLTEGLSLSRCQEGIEGQLWHESKLVRNRWWPHLPSTEEWLMFQRDAAIPPSEQQAQPPNPRTIMLNPQPWVSGFDAADAQGSQLEHLLLALGALLLLAPTCWIGSHLIKLQSHIAQLHAQQTKLQSTADPIIQARSKALDNLARINELQALAPYPSQLQLMAKVAQVLPQDRSYLKDWDYQSGQLKLTLTSNNDISTTALISALQQAGLFSEVKALPGRDAQNVTFQMQVLSR